MTDMSELTIETNGHYRELVDFCDLPEAVQIDNDWCDPEDGHMFFKYKGYWYPLSNFMRIAGDDPKLTEWDGMHSESFFSGVLIKLCPYGDGVVVGSYYV